MHQQETGDFSKRRVADDTMVLFQIALGEEIGFTPRIEALRDVLRLRKDGSPYKTMQVRKISYLRGIGTVMRYLQFSGKFVSPICIAGVLWLYFFINFSFLLLIRIRKLL